ncbi:hypothetical protein KAR91_84725 [Candidatus Pacearchaeota archaeon]|nr:hypothetical protein [Candidatus Pacearchaeota archaeon]
MKAETIADKLGEVKAKLAGLEETEKKLRALLLEFDKDVIEGQLFRVKISRYTANKTAYKAVAMKLDPSPQLLSAHTKKVPTTKFTISAKMKIAI